MVDLLLRKGADVHATTSNGDTVLHLAIASYVEPTCLEMVKCLIDAGCDLATCNSQGKTVLEIAIECKHTSVVKHLLLCNAPFPPNIISNMLRNQSTPQMVELLIHKGADVHSATSNGDTVLHLAIANHIESACLELVKRLVDAGCDFTTCNSQGKTVLEVAIEREHTSVVKYLLLCNAPFPPDIIPNMLRNQSSPQMVELLVYKGADVHSTTSDGDTVLHLAIANYIEPICWVLVKGFTEAGCDLTTRNSEGKTVFEVAFEYDYTSVMEHLLSCNAPLALSPNILPITLHARSSPWIVELLVRKGADVHSTTFNGDTVLYLAIANYVEHSCLKLVKSFMEAGCNLTTRNSEGKTAFEVAVECDYVSMVKYLLALSCSIPLAPHLKILPIALHTHSDSLAVEFLVHKGRNVHSTMSNGDTVRHLGTANYFDPSCLMSVKNFTWAGCNLTTCNSEGKTAFQVAFKYDNILMMSHVLSYDGPLALLPNTLPITLRSRSSPPMVKLLVRKGADVHSTAFNGDTALHLAIANYAESTYLELVKCLVIAGCNPTTCNSAAETPLEAAMQREYIEVMEYLLSLDVPQPPTFDILSKALQARCNPRIIQLLLSHRTSDLTVMPKSHWDTLLQLAQTSYTREDRVLMRAILKDEQDTTRRMTRQPLMLKIRRYLGNRG